MKTHLKEKNFVTVILVTWAAALMVGCKADVSPNIDNPFFAQDTAVVDPSGPIDLKLSTFSRVEFNAFKLTSLNTTERSVIYLGQKTSDAIWLSSSSYQTTGCDLSDINWSLKWITRDSQGVVTSEVAARIGEGVAIQGQETLELVHSVSSAKPCQEARFSFVVDRSSE